MLCLTDIVLWPLLTLLTHCLFEQGLLCILLRENRYIGKYFHFYLSKVCLNI